ncbi:MAG: TIGR04086 family membrane protein [Clostridia bacterium]|nr:TIGR04086 family membrane protein [Clostridia bacterium]MDY5555943.1 TIGR04086 family membrane protein [Blautia sp.]
MKVRAVLKSLLFSYALTGVFLLMLAFLLFSFNLGETAIAAGISAVYVLSCFLGGLMAGKLVKKDKYLWGIVTGFSYFLLLLAVSFAVRRQWDMSVSHAVTTFFMCVGGGALGGMLS